MSSRHTTENRTERLTAFDSTTFSRDGSFFVDKPVGSMSISPCGRDVVLASRLGLHVIDLDSPYDPPRYFAHKTPWDVADVQWSPFASRDYWVVSTSNQKALVWNLHLSPSNAVQHTLHGHSRAITDINFSAHNPDILSTCAVDSFVHCWDLRTPERPVLSFCDWYAGATQVKWNRQDPHQIASSHDKFLHIWDDRKATLPRTTIEAHETKIYGIDWNRFEADKIVTCSLDRTIKFWNVGGEVTSPDMTITTSFPVWRARHTPFGWGLLAMPQRGDFNLHLYDRRQSRSDDSGQKPETMDRSSVRVFCGHQDQIKEFLWRSRGAVENEVDNREFQLVSWSADRTLRLRHMSLNDMETVDYKPGTPVHGRLNFTRRNAVYKTYGLQYEREAEATQSAANHRSDSQMKSQKKGMTAPRPVSDWVTGQPWLAAKSETRVVSKRDASNPMNWMRGVRLGEKNTGSEQTQAIEKTDIDHFESLEEEMAHAGTRFNKVDFYEVNLKERSLRLQSHGPWGHLGAYTQIDCRLDFDSGYPTQIAPSFTLSKTTSIAENTIEEIMTSVQSIGEAYCLYKKGSLQAIIEFMIGESSLQDILSWVTDPIIRERLGIEDVASDSGSSSSDEEVVLREKPIQVHPDVNLNVPFRKAAGACWGPANTLICFFPQRQEVSMGKLTKLGGALIKSPQIPGIRAASGMSTRSSLSLPFSGSMKSDWGDASSISSGDDQSDADSDSSTSAMSLTAPEESRLAKSKLTFRDMTYAQTYSFNPDARSQHSFDGKASQMSALPRTAYFIVLHDMQTLSIDFGSPALKPKLIKPTSITVLSKKKASHYSSHCMWALLEKAGLQQSPRLKRSKPSLLSRKALSNYLTRPTLMTSVVDMHHPLGPENLVKHAYDQIHAPLDQASFRSFAISLRRFNKAAQSRPREDQDKDRILFGVQSLDNADTVEELVNQVRRSAGHPSIQETHLDSLNIGRGLQRYDRSIQGAKPIPISGARTGNSQGHYHGRKMAANKLPRDSLSPVREQQRSPNSDRSVPDISRELSGVTSIYSNIVEDERDGHHQMRGRSSAQRKTGRKHAGAKPSLLLRAFDFRPARPESPLRASGLPIIDRIMYSGFGYLEGIPGYGHINDQTVAKRFIRTSQRAALNDEASMRLHRKCRQCGGLLTSQAQLQSMACSNCQSSNYLVVCSVCDEMIRNRSFPCMLCGHSVHGRCAMTALSVLEEQEYHCTVGNCGCPCMSKSLDKKLLFGQLLLEDTKSRAKSQSALSSMVSDSTGTYLSVHKSTNPAAYESLTRNLRMPRRARGRLQAGLNQQLKVDSV